MELPGERIYYLLNSYTNGSATKEEEDELLAWIADMDNDEELKRYVNALISQHREDKFPEVNWEDVYQRVKKQIVLQNKKRWISRKRYWAGIAAAGFLFIAAGSIYLLRPNARQKLDTVAAKTMPYHNDVKPGGVKAMLKAGSASVVLNKVDTNFILAGNRVRVDQGQLKINDTKPVQYTLVVPRGGEYMLTLSDSTRIWMNADSKLEYPSVFTGKNRQVALNGEAYFEVSKDAEHPFIVKTNGQEIRVLGTAFNVEAYSDEKKATTTLISGEVEVKSGLGRVRLTGGQQLQMDGEGRFDLVENPDLEEAVAWKNGYFRFDKADIHQVMGKLSRWYDVNVQYENDKQRQYFGGLIDRNNNISQVLNLLEATGSVHFKIQGKNVIVMP